MTLGLASFLSTFFPTLGGLITFAKADALFKRFAIFMFIICVLECIGNYQFYHHQSNKIVYSICLLLETTLIPLIVLNNFKWNLVRVFIAISIIAFLSSFFFKLFQREAIQTLDTEYRIYSCILLILLSGIMIIQESKNTNIYLLLNPIFIMSFSILFYYGVSLFAYSAYHLITETNYEHLSGQIWKAHSIVNIFTNLSFTYAIWLSYRQKKFSL